MSNARHNLQSPSQRTDSGGSSVKSGTNCGRYKANFMEQYTPYQSGNVVVPVKTTTEVMDNWPFFLEGLAKLDDGFQWKMTVTPIAFLRIILRVIEGGEEEGLVGLIRSKSGKNMGFFILQNNTEEFQEPTALCYALYSVGNNSSITRDAVTFGMKWCKEKGYKSIYALSLRTGNSVKRIFTRKWGFKLHGLWFRKEVQ